MTKLRNRDLRAERQASAELKWKWTAPLELESEDDDQDEEDWTEPTGVLLTPSKE